MSEKTCDQCGKNTEHYYTLSWDGGIPFHFCGDSCLAAFVQDQEEEV